MRSLLLLFVGTLMTIVIVSMEKENVYLQHLLPHQLTFGDTSLNSTTAVMPPTRIKEPKPLDQTQLQQPALLVHVGKAGGSSIRSLLTRLDYKCRKQQQSLQNNNQTTITSPDYCHLLRITHRLTILKRRFDRILHTCGPIKIPIPTIHTLWYLYEIQLID